MTSLNGCNIGGLPVSVATLFFSFTTRGTGMFVDSSAGKQLEAAGPPFAITSAPSSLARSIEETTFVVIVEVARLLAMILRTSQGPISTAALATQAAGMLAIWNRAMAIGASASIVAG